MCKVGRVGMGGLVDVSVGAWWKVSRSVSGNRITPAYIPRTSGITYLGTKESI